MKIRIKLDLYFFKEYFIAPLCEKNVVYGLSKSSEMAVKMRNGSLTGYDHLQHEGLYGIVGT